MPNEDSRLGVVKRVPSYSLKNHPLSLFGHEHNRLMLARGTAADELTLDFSAELFESPLLLRHARPCA